jgi:hypothetical protein
VIRAWLTCVVVLAACDRGDTSQWGKPAPGSATATEAVAPPEAKVAPPAPEPPATFRYGDKVSAQWTNGKWYRGTLTAVYSDGTADVRYDDGDRSKGLPFEKIKLIKRPLFEVEARPAKRGLVEGASCAGVGWQYVCGGRCTDTKTDSANCGGCGRRCDSGYSCDGSGTCRDANGNL